MLVPEATSPPRMTREVACSSMPILALTWMGMCEPLCVEAAGLSGAPIREGPQSVNVNMINTRSTLD